MRTRPAISALKSNLNESCINVYKTGPSRTISSASIHPPPTTIVLFRQYAHLREGLASTPHHHFTLIIPNIRPWIYCYVKIIIIAHSWSCPDEMMWVGWHPLKAAEAPCRPVYVSCS